jgi:DNA-binding NarL/FixJ family response regulator
MSAFRILIADDHCLIRLGLRSLIESHSGWTVCGEATDGTEAIEKCEQLHPDLLTLDICMPKRNGVDAACHILKANPNQRILVVTDVDSETVIGECLAAGIRGWVWKSDGFDDLIQAVQEMQNGRTYFTPLVGKMVLNGYLAHKHPAENTLVRLSPREREVVQLISEGYATKEVAVALTLSVKTAETHRNNIMRKLGIHSVSELVLYAVRNNIIQVQLPVVARANDNDKPYYRRSDPLPQHDRQLFD